MRALVVAAPGSFAVEEVDEPRPGPGEVAVEVGATGICGSDLELLDGWPSAWGSPPRLVRRLPVGRPLELAALLEPMACVANGLLEAGMPRPGSRLAVVGDGPLGLLGLLLSRTLSPAELVLVSRRPARGMAGKDCGATAVLLGISSAGRATIDPDTITLGHLRVYGIFAASRAAWQWAVQLYAAGALDPSPLVTHRFALDDLPEALETLRSPSGGAIKVLVRPGGTIP
jgi:threonine dehydrogenase-like Zn-dependent dehydrogenase